MNNFLNDLLKEIKLYAVEHRVPIIRDNSAAVLAEEIRKKSPEKILEIGAAIGYSGILMLNESPGSILYTIEISDDLVKMANENFKRAGFEKRVVVFKGDANEIIPLIDGCFDFIFLDGPKAQYINYLPFILKLLESGGVLFCDNVLFKMHDGQGASGRKSKSSIVKNLRLFLDEICSNEQLSTRVLEIDDGLSISLKK
jgi:predicted O-methyltransferase YrrM